MPTCGLFGGSGRLPVAQPSTAGGPAHDRHLVPPALDALQDLAARRRRRRVSSVHALELSVMPSRSPTICSVAPAPRDADSHPPKSSSRDRSRPGMRFDGIGQRRRGLGASVNPPAGPSSATSSKGTFCATVIITCCSLAFGAEAHAARPCCPARASPGAPLRRARAPPTGRARAGSIDLVLERRARRRRSPAPASGAGRARCSPQTTIW